MNKAVILDRDGTINYDYGYVIKKEDFIMIPGAIEGMRNLCLNGYKLIIITNQSGVSRGFFSEESLIQINSWFISYLLNFGVLIEKIYYCPHFESGKIGKYAIKCNCRKPSLELFYKAIYEYNINIEKSFVIGDRLSDLSLTKNETCCGILIGNTENESTISHVKKGELRQIVYRQDLFESSCYILKR